VERVEADLSFLDDVVFPPLPELRPDEDLFDDPEELLLLEVFPFINLVLYVASMSMPA